MTLTLPLNLEETAKKRDGDGILSGSPRVRSHLRRRRVAIAKRSRRFPDDSRPGTRCSPRDQRCDPLPRSSRTRRCLHSRSTGVASQHQPPRIDAHLTQEEPRSRTPRAAPPAKATDRTVWIEQFFERKGENDILRRIHLTTLAQVLAHVEAATRAYRLQSPHVRMGAHPPRRDHAAPGSGMARAGQRRTFRDPVPVTARRSRGSPTRLSCSGLLRRLCRRLLERYVGWDEHAWTQMNVSGPFARVFGAAATLNDKVVLFGGSGMYPGGGELEPRRHLGLGRGKLDEGERLGARSVGARLDGHIERGGRLVRLARSRRLRRYIGLGRRWLDSAKCVGTRPAQRRKGGCLQRTRHLARRFASDVPGSFPDDTWSWDGSHWTQQGGPGPSAREGHTMTGP